MAAALLLLPGCAGLPNARADRAKPHVQQVTFEATRGAVSDARSAGILTRLQGQRPDSDLLDIHLAYQQSINVDSPLVLGNKLTLLQNGPDTYRSMFAVIRGARDHVNLETFIFEDDETGRAFADALLERQAVGVQVNVIYDSVGGMSTPEAFFERGPNLLARWLFRDADPAAEYSHWSDAMISRR